MTSCAQLMLSIRSTSLFFFSCSMLSAIYVTFSLRPNCRQVVQSACHYVQTEQSLIERQHCEQKAKRRGSEAMAAVAAAVRQYPCQVQFCMLLSFSISDHMVFVFPSVRWKWASVLSSASHPLQVLLLSSPRHAAIRLATHRRQRRVLPPASSWKPRSQFRFVRHPPWQQMCAQLWRLPWWSLFVRFPTSYC